jgi:methylated-DNA-[protein]-cysteine S-methyltransferase
MSEMRQMPLGCHGYSHHMTTASRVAGAPLAPASPVMAPNRTASPDFLRRIDSPLGRIELVSDGEAIVSLAIECEGALPFDDIAEHTAPVLDIAITQLREYFAGTRTDFDVPVLLAGTAFQQTVWRELARMPFGTVTSYGALGHATGRPTAGRAVGGAVGANPVPIIVPCHRVLATSGRITGFSAGEGIATKAWLLDHEGIEHRL